MRICQILLLCGAVSLILYLREKIRRYSVKAVLLKSLVSVLFVAVAVCGWYASSTEGPQPLGIFVILGLLFGLLGDIWLDLKYVFPEKDGIFTYAGFAVFGVGHLLYVTGLAIQYADGNAVLPLAAAMALAVMMGLGNLLLEKPMKLRYGKMKPVVAAYGALLFATVLVSGVLALLHAWRETTLDLFFVGAVLFAVSDLVLSGTYFGQGKERPRDLILNYLTYYGGQFLIAYSLLFLR